MAQLDRIEPGPAAAVERMRQRLDPGDVVGIVGHDDCVGIGDHLDTAEPGDQRLEHPQCGFGRDIVQPDGPRDHQTAAAAIGRFARRAGLRDHPPGAAVAHDGKALAAQHRHEQLPDAVGTLRRGRDHIDRAFHCGVENDRASGQPRHFLRDIGNFDIAHVDRHGRRRSLAGDGLRQKRRRNHQRQQRRARMPKQQAHAHVPNERQESARYADLPD